MRLSVAGRAVSLWNAVRAQMQINGKPMTRCDSSFRMARGPVRSGKPRNRFGSYRSSAMICSGAGTFDLEDIRRRSATRWSTRAEPEAYQERPGAFHLRSAGLDRFLA